MSSNNRLAKCFGDIVAAVDLTEFWTARHSYDDLDTGIILDVQQKTPRTA